MKRSKKSRAEELRFIAGFLFEPKALFEAFEANKYGGNSELEGIKFTWGNIKDLLLDLDVSKIPREDGVLFQVPLHSENLLKLDPKHIFHLDNLSADQERQLTDEFEIPIKSLSFHLNKADILIRDGNHQMHYVSVKDETAVTKLGQVANKKYGSTSLVGGFSGVDISHFNIPSKIDREDTFLDHEQWAKLQKSLKHRRCAYIKKNYPEEWCSIVDNALKAAYQCLKEFSIAISEDRNCLSQYLLLTLVGESVLLDNFYLVFGPHVINAQRLLKNIETMDYKIESEWYSSTGEKHKESLIIWLVFPDKKYCLTKIEPAFDGGTDLKASQTKGIQYYFQQWPNKKIVNNSERVAVYDFKQLLLDIGQ
jgi:hypothetical protein